MSCRGYPGNRDWPTSMIWSHSNSLPAYSFPTASPGNGPGTNLLKKKNGKSKASILTQALETKGRIRRRSALIQEIEILSCSGRSQRGLASLPMRKPPHSSSLAPTFGQEWIPRHPHLAVEVARIVDPLVQEPRHSTSKGEKGNYYTHPHRHQKPIESRQEASWRQTMDAEAHGQRPRDKRTPATTSSPDRARTWRASSRTESAKPSPR